jgi:hypothetical protein
MKRRENLLQALMAVPGLPRAAAAPPPGVEEELPRGIRRSQAAAAMTAEELHALRKTARHDAVQFETLRQQQVSDLSQASMPPRPVGPGS